MYPTVCIVCQVFDKRKMEYIKKIISLHMKTSDWEFCDINIKIDNEI